MTELAHIGNVPVEEWLPFLVPVIALYLFARRRERRRRDAVKKLLERGGPPDRPTVEKVLARWTEAGHRDLAAEHLALLYPPGPDGATAAELAQRLGDEQGAIARRLDDLAELGYLEFEEDAPAGETRAWLTPQGCDVVNLTEDALLAAMAPPERSPTAKR